MKYQKSWISINEQIALLTENKGLKCSNQSELERALVEVGYYRQSTRALLLVRALKPQQPLLTVETAGISIERPVGRHHAMARHNNRNGIACNRGPHGTGRHNGSLVSRHTMSSRNTLGDLAIRSDLATRNRKQLVPNFTLKRRADHMQRRRKPRFLPCKISIQPSPRTPKHRRGRTICGTYRRHATGTGNRVGAFNMFGIFFEKRGAKVLLPLKPKPRQTAAISGKQDFAQRRSKRRRDHQRLLSKLRKHNTANCADNPNRPQSHPKQQACSAAATGCAPQSPKAAGAKRRGRRRDQGPLRPRALASAQRPQPTTVPSQTARSNVTAGGGRAQFSEHSADQCGALSAAPKEQDKAPHMVEDVLKTEPGPRRRGHTTRRAA